MTRLAVLPQESFSPIYVGDTGALFAPQFLDDTNTTIDLTGATLSVRMVNETGVVKTWTTNAWTIDDAPEGKAHYNYQAADVDTAGTWTVQVTITINGKPKHTDTRTLVIETPI